MATQYDPPQKKTPKRLPDLTGKDSYTISDQMAATQSHNGIRHDLETGKKGLVIRPQWRDRPHDDNMHIINVSPYRRKLEAQADETNARTVSDLRRARAAQIRLMELDVDTHRRRTGR